MESQGEESGLLGDKSGGDDEDDSLEHIKDDVNS
jgi:hypothetical protein